jgi:hypothetical protein
VHDRELSAAKEICDPAPRASFHTCTKELEEQAFVPHGIERFLDVEEGNG